MAVLAPLITPVPARTGAADTLATACGRAAGIVCRLVWDLSHSAHAADFTSVYLAGPISLVLRIAFVILLAIAIRLAAQRVINRVARRATFSRAQGEGDPDDAAEDADDADDLGGPAETEAAAAGRISSVAGPGDVSKADTLAPDSIIGPDAAGPGQAAVTHPGRPGLIAGRRSRRTQRATALASVLSNAASVTIFTVAGFIVLGDLGLNLAPVLASAGVLGIAIGFGAQNLVQDFLAGIFMLLEDQYGVGDVVDIGSVTGTVEAVSLRITRLRDVNGVVWHIRNGTIKRAGNETHGWARAVIDFPVPYQVPLATARSLLERAATGMWEEPAWHSLITERPQVWGVEDVSTETIVIRVTARTVPQGKLEVARELRERLKFAMDSAIRAVTAADGPGAAIQGAAVDAAAGPLPPRQPPQP